MSKFMTVKKADQGIEIFALAKIELKKCEIQNLKSSNPKNLNLKS